MGGGGGECMYYSVSGGGNCCWGTGVSQEQEPRTTGTSLLTPYLSPALTFLPFWKSRGGERGGCEVDVCGSCDQELTGACSEVGVADVPGAVLCWIHRGYVVCMLSVASIRQTVCLAMSWCRRMFQGMVLGCGAVRRRCAAVIRVVCW